MLILDRVAAILKASAAQAVQIAVEEGVELIGKVAHDVSDAFMDLVEKESELATKLVTDLFSNDTLNGLEKANLAATQFVESTSQRGIEVAAQDVTALIKSAYLAVKAQIASL